MSYEIDSYYMRLALDEAKKGIGYTSPNPLVGAVIVKDGNILSTGYHKKRGENHAEIDAINKVKNKKDLKDATLYVNLEPCCHHGLTPPCTDTIIKSGIKKVVIANLDCDERVCGKGINFLNLSGIETNVGILSQEDLKLNSIYYFYKKNKRPYIILKAALTLDGKIATKDGDSKWISNEESRYIVHKLRLRINSIAIGKRTVLIDKPLLNCRINNYTNKPINKLIFTRTKSENLFSLFAPNSGKNYIIDDSITKTKESFIDFCNKEEIDSILIEGGAEVYSWFLLNDLVDRIFLFYKPAFLGKDGKNFYNKVGTSLISELIEFEILQIKKMGNNIMIEFSKGEPICLLEL